MNTRNNLKLPSIYTKSQNTIQNQLIRDYLFQFVDMKRLRVPNLNKSLFSQPLKAFKVTPLNRLNLLFCRPNKTPYKYTAQPKKLDTPIFHIELFSYKNTKEIYHKTYNQKEVSISHLNFIYVKNVPIYYNKYKAQLDTHERNIKVEPIRCFVTKNIVSENYEVTNSLIERNINNITTSLVNNTYSSTKTFNYNEPKFSFYKQEPKVTIFKLNFLKITRSSVYLNRNIDEYLTWFRLPIYHNKLTYKTNKTNKNRIFKCLFKPLFNSPIYTEQKIINFDLYISRDISIPTISFVEILNSIKNKMNEYFVQDKTHKVIHFQKATQLKIDCYSILVEELSNLHELRYTIQEHNQKMNNGIFNICKFLELLLPTLVRTIIYRGLINLYAMLILLRPLLNKLRSLLKLFNNQHNSKEIKNLLSILNNINFIGKVIVCPLNGVLHVNTKIKTRTLQHENIGTLKHYDSYMVSLEFEEKGKPVSIEQLVVIINNNIYESNISKSLYFENQVGGDKIHNLSIYSDYKEEGLIVGLGSNLEECVVIINTQRMINNGDSIENLAKYIVTESIKYNKITILFVLENRIDATMKAVLGCTEFFLLIGLGLAPNVLFDMILDIDVYEKEEIDLDNKQKFYAATNLFNQHQINVLSEQLSNKKLFEIIMEENEPELESYKMTKEQLRLFKQLIYKEIIDV